MNKLHIITFVGDNGQPQAHTFFNQSEAEALFIEAAKDRGYSGEESFDAVNEWLEDDRRPSELINYEVVDLPHLVESDQVCHFIEGSDIVPAAWRSFFWGAISLDAPFSFGDNNRTLIRPGRLLSHTLETFGISESDFHNQDVIELDLVDAEGGVIARSDFQAFKNRLDEAELKNVYIDVEN